MVDRAAALNILFLAFGLTLARAETARTTPENRNAFMAGDRWAVIGDSITHSGTYHAYIAAFYFTRFPQRPFEVANCGIAGDTAAGGLRRLAWDILPEKPTVATIDFGMNDVGRHLYVSPSPSEAVLADRRKAIATLLANQRAIVSQLQQRGIRVILLTPSIFDDEVRLPSNPLRGANAALGECAAGVKALAEETGCGLIDWHGPMTALNRQLQTKDPAFTLTGADRIHPGPLGHAVMAALFLKAQAVSSTVAELSLDASTLAVIHTSNGKAEDFRRNKDGFSFVWFEDALPFPFDEAFTQADEWLHVTDDLNREILQIGQLAPGRYRLKIDGAEICESTAEELARGLNLAKQTKTPQYQQAMTVLKTVQIYTHENTETVRNIALVEHQSVPADVLPAGLAVIRPYLDTKLATFKDTSPSSNLLRIYTLYPNEKSHVAETRAALAAAQNWARELARPRPHRFEITAIPAAP